VNNNLIKIAITGPESTGKSLLASQLADHYNTVYVAEYAREYIDQLNRPYTFDDVLYIAQGQLAREKAAESEASRFLFCDTELLVTHIWCMHKYGKSHDWIEEQILSNPYDLFLLCNIDLPWEYDKQREHPALREFFFNWYRKELEGFNFPYRIISGEGKERTQHAISVIDQFFLPRP
jgi:NadR type nicotinamide-nucleotide adenylyltransferase